MSIFALIILKKGSTVRINMMGESGHPCRVPLPIGNDSDMTSFTFTLALGHEYKLVIQFNIPFFIPIFCKTALRNVYSTRSNAFSASADTITNGFCWEWDNCMALRTLCVFSLPSLPGVNPT